MIFHSQLHPLNDIFIQTIIKWDFTLPEVSWKPTWKNFHHIYTDHQKWWSCPTVRAAAGDKMRYELFRAAGTERMMVIRCDMATERESILHYLSWGCKSKTILEFISKVAPSQNPSHSGKLLLFSVSWYQLASRESTKWNSIRGKSLQTNTKGMAGCLRKTSRAWK